tara:strand:+ start:207 stop:842 length:636 start_codon:yes stop_codon:yes gene_type:complete
MVYKYASIFLALILMFSASNCSKGTAMFTISGNISDATLGGGLENGSISIYKVPVGSSEKILIESKIIEANGGYSFSFPREAMEKYIIEVTKENYFDINKDISFSSLSSSNENFRDYNTTAKSWVKIKLLNNNPSSSDHLRFIKQQGKENCLECCPISEQNYYGAIDTSIYCINDANTNYSIYYWLVGTSTQNLLSVNTTIFDTTDIILQY